MKKLLAVVAAMLAVLAVGFAAGRFWWTDSRQGANSAASSREILYWVAPMDPNFRREAPGKSPMGMDLVPVYADEASAEGPDVVSIDPAIVNNLGVRTAPAQRGALSRHIETVGYVDYDEATLKKVHTRVDGWIEQLEVKATGVPVVKGQALFELYSPTLVNAQEEFLATLDSAARGLADAAAQRLLALGVSQEQIDRLARDRRVQQRITVAARTDGHVAHLGVREGVYVTPATAIMTIAKLDPIWVLAEVFERQVKWVKPGQPADIELDAMPGKRWQTTVDYVYPELDEVTRTLKVRLRLENADDLLRPNMFTRVTIYGAGTDPVVHVPREALIRGGKVNRVVVSLGDGRFRAQPVEIGMESGTRVAIRRGVAAGERVVTSGQFLIDSESNIDAALKRFQSTAESETGHSQMGHETTDDHEEHRP